MVSPTSSTQQQQSLLPGSLSLDYSAVANGLSRSHFAARGQQSTGAISTSTSNVAGSTTNRSSSHSNKSGGSSSHNESSSAIQRPPSSRSPILSSIPNSPLHANFFKSQVATRKDRVYLPENLKQLSYVQSDSATISTTVSARNHSASNARIIHESSSNNADITPPNGKKAYDIFGGKGNSSSNNNNNNRSGQSSPTIEEGLLSRKGSSAIIAADTSASIAFLAKKMQRQKQNESAVNSAYNMPSPTTASQLQMKMATINRKTPSLSGWTNTIDNSSGLSSTSSMRGSFASFSQHFKSNQSLTPVAVAASPVAIAQATQSANRSLQQSGRFSDQFENQSNEKPSEAATTSSAAAVPASVSLPPVLLPPATSSTYRNKQSHGKSQNRLSNFVSKIEKDQIVDNKGITNDIANNSNGSHFNSPYFESTTPISAKSALNQTQILKQQQQDSRINDVAASTADVVPANQSLMTAAISQMPGFFSTRSGVSASARQSTAARVQQKKSSRESQQIKSISSQDILDLQQTAGSISLTKNSFSIQAIPRSSSSHASSNQSTANIFKLVNMNNKKSDSISVKPQLEQDSESNNNNLNNKDLNINNNHINSSRSSTGNIYSTIKRNKQIHQSSSNIQSNHHNEKQRIPTKKSMSFSDSPNDPIVIPLIDSTKSQPYTKLSPATQLFNGNRKRNSVKGNNNSESVTPKQHSSIPSTISSVPSLKQNNAPSAMFSSQVSKRQLKPFSLAPNTANITSEVNNDSQSTSPQVNQANIQAIASPTERRVLARSTENRKSSTKQKSAAKSLSMLVSAQKQESSDQSTQETIAITIGGTGVSPFAVNSKQQLIESSPKKYRLKNQSGQNQSFEKQFESDLKKSPSKKEDIQHQSAVHPARAYYLENLVDAFKTPHSSDKFLALCRQHFLQTCQGVQFSNIARALNPRDLALKKVTLDKKTLVFDMDETLMHCNEQVTIPSDIVVDIQFPNGDMIHAGINIRPFAKEILEELSSEYEIVIFTASHKSYATAVIEQLDPTGRHVHHRFFRDSCIQSPQGVYIKDLRIFSDRPLNEVVLIDNAAHSFSFQVANGIPIFPFYDNKNDRELPHLLTYLRCLGSVSDVREYNKEQIKTHFFNEPEGPQKVLNRLFA